MLFPILVFPVLIDSVLVWRTMSTVNKHIYFCESEDCSNETHGDTLCDTCHSARVARVCGTPPDYNYSDNEHLEYKSQHKCIPIHVDNGFRDYYLCDDADSPTCPQNFSSWN
jgi:hypothetical protein